MAYLAHQWWLAIGRSRGWVHQARRTYRMHKWLGAAAPLFFYVHSTGLGYGYLTLLGATFFGNVGLGLVSPDVFHRKPRWYTGPWMVAHVALAVAVTALALYHLGIALSFE